MSLKQFVTVQTAIKRNLEALHTLPDCAGVSQVTVTLTADKITAASNPVVKKGAKNALDRQVEEVRKKLNVKRWKELFASRDDLSKLVFEFTNGVLGLDVFYATPVPLHAPVVPKKKKK